MAVDISIVCAADAQPWGLYLQEKLSGEKYGCSVIVNVLQTSGSLDDKTEQEHLKAQVQALLLSPVFLTPFELCDKDNASDLPNYGPLFPRHCRSVVIYCGCEADDADMLEIMSKQFRNFSKWSKCSAGQKDGEINELLATIIRVLEQEGSNGTDSGFKEDDMYAIPPLPRSIGNISFKIIPEQITNEGSTVYLLFYESVTSPVSVQFGDDLKHEVICKEESASTFSFTCPSDLKPSENEMKVTIFSNGEEIGSDTIIFESQLDTLSRLLKSTTNPVDFMAKALGIEHSLNNLSTLDQKLKEIFKSYIPGGQLQDIFKLSTKGFQLGSRSDKELPTLIHFAAHFGLKEFCCELLTCPGAAQAYAIENKNGELPHDIAQLQGHTDLANFLTTYMETGVPIALVFNQVATGTSGTIDDDDYVPRLPPQPCRGSLVTTDSIYMDMSSKQSGSSSINIDLNKPVSVLSVTSQESGSQDTHPTNVHGEDVKEKPEKPAIPPRDTRPKTASTVTNHVSSPTVENIHSPSLSVPAPIPRLNKALSTPDYVDNTHTKPKRNRSHSDSDVSSDSSHDGGHSSHGVKRNETLPPPFKPGPVLSAKEIPRVNLTEMSIKDKELRRILQSAAGGMVSMEEAKGLVDQWDTQYAQDKGQTMNELQSNTLKEGLSPTETSSKPRKNVFSKFFRGRSKSSSAEDKRPKYKKTFRTGGRSLSHTGLEEEQGAGQKPYKRKTSLGNLKHPPIPESNFQRADSIRVSNALRDTDILNLPALPKRLSRSENKISTSSSKTDDSKMQIRLFQKAPSFSTDGGFPPSSPRLPDPDLSF